MKDLQRAEGRGQMAKNQFSDGQSQFARTRTRKIIAIGLVFSSLALAEQFAFPMHSSVVSPDGKTVWTVEAPSNRESGNPTQYFASISNQDWYPGYEPDKPPIAAFSSDGGVLAFVDEGEVQVLDFAKKQQVSSFKAKNTYQIAFFGRSLMLAARGSDVLQVSSIAGKLGAKFKFVGVGTNLTHLSLSADGKRGVLLMYSKGANFATIVDFTKNAKVLGTSGGTKTGIYTTCAANAVGSRFVCGTDTGEIAILDSSGKILQTQQAFKTEVQSVVFAKNNLFASSATESGVFK
jgi:hypothetical protein